MRNRILLLATAALLAPASAALAQATPTPAPTTTPAPATTPAKPATGERATAVEGVTVTADPNATRTYIDRNSYSVANDLQAQTGSVSDALRNVPGVQVDVQGNVSLRGQGVTILVDGKPSALFNGETQADALQQMPADQIERVEVITNPSAEFSPEGGGGMINLVTKKVRRQMRTATVKGNVGADGRFNAGVSGSIVEGPLTVTGNAGFRRGVTGYTVDSERSRFDAGSGQFIDSRQTLEALNEGDSWQLRGGVEYDVDPKTRLSGELRYSLSDFGSNTDEHYEGEDAGGAVVTDYDRNARYAVQYSNTGATGRYRRQFDGTEHDFSAELSYDHITADREQRALRSFNLPPLADEFEIISTQSVVDRTRLGFDYNRPLPGDQRLKIGSEFRFDDNSFDFRGDRGPAPGSTAPVPALTNLFEYSQHLQAFYVTYERPLGPVRAQFGLRVEAVQTDINQVTSGITDENSDVDLYPTLHLSYDLNDKQKLTGSFSRRIQRPQANDLNPYVTYQDPFNLRAGNPDLDPQITDSYEAGWQFRSGQTFYQANLYWHESRDGIADVSRDIGGGVFLTTRENLAQERSGGVELIASGRINAALTYQITGEVYWNEIDPVGLVTGGPRSNTTYFANGSLNWQVTPNDFVQFSGYAWGAGLTPQGQYDGSSAFNAGYRHKFNDTVSFVFTAQDIFAQSGYVQIIDTPLLRGRSIYRYDARTFYAGLTFSFGGGPRRQPDRFDFDSAGAGPPGG